MDKHTFITFSYQATYVFPLGLFYTIVVLRNSMQDVILVKCHQCSIWTMHIYFLYWLLLFQIFHIFHFFCHHRRFFHCGLPHDLLCYHIYMWFHLFFEGCVDYHMLRTSYLHHSCEWQGLCHMSMTWGTLPVQFQCPSVEHSKRFHVRIYLYTLIPVNSCKCHCGICLKLFPPHVWLFLLWVKESLDVIFSFQVSSFICYDNFAVIFMCLIIYLSVRFVPYKVWFYSRQSCFLIIKLTMYVWTPE